MLRSRMRHRAGYQVNVRLRILVAGGGWEGYGCRGESQKSGEEGDERDDEVVGHHGDESYSSAEWQVGTGSR